MSTRPIFINPRRIGVSSLRLGAFYTVASVELGNTTAKCILTSTNLKTAEIFVIEKEIVLTRGIRSVVPTESVFGRTMTGIELSQESVAELVATLISSVVSRARMSIEGDLHFVVRSTGITAGFERPEEIGTIVKALADGCLLVGVPPKKMTASLAPNNLPPSLRDYTWLQRVHFDGAIASSLPPANTEIVANEMEGELVTAGIKGAAKSTDIDFRNPVMTLDFGTTLAGRVTDDGHPYAKTIGSFAGLAGAIPDALARGALLPENPLGCVMDLSENKRSKAEATQDEVDAVHEYIRVERVTPGTKRFGTVPVNAEAADESGVVLIGVDAGTDGSRLADLEILGRGIVEANGISYLLRLIDEVQARTAQRIVSLAEEEGLLHPNTSLGLTGRGITTGEKPSIIASTLESKDGKHWMGNRDLIFVEDGLALGAAVAGRCMNSMGTRTNPMGGRKGDGCIMGARMKRQRHHQSKR
ncbi:MAG: methanogenesis marker 14 protein [Candidatus Thorarchaeota archaeon]|nr:MAG: methanogenesis marker 14 protein [Candidatus Thorarchaeota archaeon]